MLAAIVGLIVFACAFGGAAIGMRLRALLPQHHLDAASQDTVKIAIGLIATMTALVLGLVTASAKGSFDDVENAVKHTAVEVLALDRALARYGPETRAIRVELAGLVEERIALVWPAGARQPAGVDSGRGSGPTRGEKIADAIRLLQPNDSLQRELQARAEGYAVSLLDTRWLALTATARSVPTPFLVVLTLWLTIIFASFGLFAPGNATVVSALFVAAVSVACALFLVLELESPFDGVLRTSPEPLQQALIRINR